MKWKAALQGVKGALATARQEVKAKQILNRPSHLTRSISPSRSRMFIAGTAAIVVLGSTATLVAAQVAHTSSWLQVYRSGQYVGLVPNQSNVTLGMERIADGYGIQFQTTSVHENIPSTYNWHETASFPTQAVVIQLDDKPLVYTTSKPAAQKVLNDVKQALAPKVKGASHVTSQFVGHVTVAAVTVGIQNILQADDATRLLLHPVSSQIAGRSSSPAAMLLKSSDESRQNPLQPLLTVQSVATVTKTVSMPYHVTYVDDDALAKGDEKVVAAGHNGNEQDAVRETLENGKVIKSQVISRHTIEQPVNEVVHRGTNSGVASGEWVWPTVGTTITSPFGERSLNGGEFHPGVDIGVPIGTPVYATNNGTVISAGWNSGGYGNWVEIDNGGGITTVFGHMSRVVAQSGQTVSKGELIGYSGDTGEATGPHLHYEVRRNGTPVNPMPYT